MDDIFDEMGCFGWLLRNFLRRGLVFVGLLIMAGVLNSCIGE